MAPYLDTEDSLSVDPKYQYHPTDLYTDPPSDGCPCPSCRAKRGSAPNVAGIGQRELRYHARSMAQQFFGYTSGGYAGSTDVLKSPTLQAIPPGYVEEMLVRFAQQALAQADQVFQQRMARMERHFQIQLRLAETRPAPANASRAEKAPLTEGRLFRDGEELYAEC